MNAIINSMIRHSGRSWWQARFSDGHVIAEWDMLTTKLLLPIGKGATSRWEELNKKDMIGLRLLCPNGMAGELEAPEGHRFFQLKAGGIGVGIGGSNRYVDAHIIGVVVDDKGNCLCRAWEYQLHRLIEFRDNVFNMQYQHIGKLSLEVQQLKV